MAAEYNNIDVQNDTLTVIRAKVEALSKALRKRAEDNEAEKDEINALLGKPLGEWP